MQINYKKRQAIHSIVISAFLLSALLFVSCNNDSSEVDTVPIPEPEQGLTYIDKSCSSCDYVIAATEWQFDGALYDLKAGDTIGIVGGADGKRDGLNIKNIKVAGMKPTDDPIVIINCNGRVELGYDKNVSKGIDVENAQYFKIAGTGSTAHAWGIAVRGFQGLEVRGQSSDYEIYGVEVLETGYAGITCRTDAACDGSVSLDFTQYNTILHHNYVHNTGGEGFYIGGSHWNSGQTEQPGCVGTLIWEPQLVGVRIHNNFVRDIGRDGIQVGSTVEDCKIYNNVVLDYGMAEDYGHMTGFQINPGTTGELYNNIIVGGKGFGIFCVGQGGNTIYNNLIVNPTFDGVYVDERLKDDNKRDWYFRIINNTIVNPGVNGINFNSGKTTGNEIVNNIITTPSKAFIDGWDNYNGKATNLLTDKDTLHYLTPYSGQNTYVELLKLNYSASNIPAGVNVKTYGILEDILGYERLDSKIEVGAFQYQK
jgi:hypothetical protein